MYSLTSQNNINGTAIKGYLITFRNTLYFQHVHRYRCRIIELKEQYLPKFSQPFQTSKKALYLEEPMPSACIF